MKKLILFFLFIMLNNNLALAKEPFKTKISKELQNIFKNKVKTVKSKASSKALVNIQLPLPDFKAISNNLELMSNSSKNVNKYNKQKPLLRKRPKIRKKSKTSYEIFEYKPGQNKMKIIIVKPNKN